MKVTAPKQDRRTPADTLRGVHVGLRKDLQVSRHLFRGEVSYIIRDPMTFQSQRLNLGDYELFVNIHASSPLSAIFDSLVERRKLSQDDEGRFYQFVLGLHRLGFLRLPVADDKLLYERYRIRQQAKRREKLMGFLFLRIPLWNPDAFLDRTIHLVRPLFGTAALIVWALLMLSAGYVAVVNWQELVRPDQGVLIAGNLPLLWITLIGLKVFHELGHAYACKHYGGHVPEMGAYLIMFTPCAYMDATASWGFSRKRERLIVCFGGMYVESFFAAIAMFVWAATEQSLLNSFAYNVIFLAGVITVLFNINPLMRFDGYYILSDFVEIPNLRQRSTRQVLNVLKRLLLGIKVATESGGRRMRAILLTYGVALSMYRAALLVTIAAVLILKLHTLGLVLGCGFIAATAIGIVRSLMRYLWHAEETIPVRRRAIAYGVVFLLLLPSAVFWLPVPTSVRAAASLVTQQETVVRAKTSGFLADSLVRFGEVVHAGELVARLTSDSSAEPVIQASADLRATRIRRDAYQVHDPARALQEESRMGRYESALASGLAEQARLDVVAPTTGRVVDCLPESAVGSFLPEGSPIATIAAGSWAVRAILTEEQIVRTGVGVGEVVEFRSTAEPARSIEGTVSRIAPAGSRIVELAALTHLGGGEIVVDPDTGEASKPYFELTIDLSGTDTSTLRHGMTGYVQLDGGSESIGRTTGRRILRFWNRLIQG